MGKNDNINDVVKSYFSCHYSLFYVRAENKMKLTVSEGILMGVRNSGLYHF